jgi:hypothetical protein
MLAWLLVVAKVWERVMLKSFLDYILVKERLDFFFLSLGWLLPVLGIAGGSILGFLKKNTFSYVFRGLSLGLCGPLVSALWLAYNAIVNHFGIDSVKGLLLNLLLFILTGIVIGFVVRFVRARHSTLQGLN